MTQTNSLDSTAPTETLDWHAIVQIEPRLRDLEKQSLDADCSDDWEWSRIKHSVSTMVGWEAKSEALRSDGAYDIAYQRLRRSFEN